MLSPILVSFESLNIASIMPMLIVIGGGLLILVIDFMAKIGKLFYALFSIAVVALSIMSLVSLGGQQEGFFGLVRLDNLAIISQLVMLVASLLFLPLSLTSQRFHEFEYPEFFALFLFVLGGFQFMVSTDNLMLIFIGLETASLALYAIICMHNRDRSTEAAIKYFTMGSFAAGMFVFGAMFFYLACGSVEIDKAYMALEQNQYKNIGFMLVSLAFFVAALGFKLSVVPFHTWTPDVYEGASAPLAGYMSIVPKIAGFVVAIRLLEYMTQIDFPWLEDMLWIFAVATMTIGNVLALVQESVKRMLAFSSISHAGFGMVAILVGTTESNSALMMYWALFMFANIGAFTMLWISRHKSKIFHNRYDHPYTKFSGMVYISPIGAVVMAVFMLGLAGVPPFALFWGKFYLISSAVQSGYIILALIMLLNSAIAVYYYLKLIVYMFLREPSYTSRTIYMHNITAPFRLIVAICAVATVFSVFLIEVFHTNIYTLLQNAGF